MHSERQDVFARARDRIAVPSVPLAAIRAAAARRPERMVDLRKRILAGVFAGLALAGAAAAADRLMTTRFIVSPTGGLRVQNQAKDVRTIVHPTDAQLREVAKSMNFRVTLPSGLPLGTIRTHMVRLGPDAMMIWYDLPGAARASNHLFLLVLANPETVAPPGTKRKSNLELQLGGQAARGSQTWRVGGETVIVPDSTITPAELAHIKAAMTSEASR